MASTDARPIPRKNTAFRAYFNILDADGDPVTGASSLDSEVSIDGGSFADCTNEATEIGSSGMYYLDLTSGEMNGDAVCVQVKTATSGAKTTQLVFYPEEAGDVRVDVVQISGDGTAADNLEAAADGNGYNLGGGSVVAASVTGDIGGKVLGGGSGTITGVGVSAVDGSGNAIMPASAYTAPLDAAGIRAALGLSSANLDTQLGDLPTNAELAAALAVDGLSFASAMEVLLAVLAGVAVPSGSTVAFKKRDGSTTKLTITYGSADGERTASVIS